MIHEYVYLSVPARHHAEVSERLAQYVAKAAAGGRMLGCWATETGALNQIVLMRAYETDMEFMAERRQLAMATDPFSCESLMTGYSAEAYLPFSWIDPVPAGRFGPCYELRTYDLRVGTLPTLIEAWKRKLPARAGMSPVLAAGAALDGTPRFTHLWPYASFEERLRIRSEAARAGIWPPNAFPGTLPPPMQSSICLPLPCSPLQ
ncbi:NIPSNAP family protein [Bosea sp. (in: a-proteobacteria)]|uniref:NIPSNAP family protein n=1 Tax=Bosea sp. (in: a-proteobacteria) TaxID=1871050 RepID=UPI002624BC41|nr:NIPSNAP family protein [Bosea sp. (in: a-proteobacteria)]MCO5093139.1 NIPSNAP family protein [Bosea sp. (in: a-proteobacteria)]